MTPVSTSQLHAGQVFEIIFLEFVPRITIQSERELTVEIISGDNAVFIDTVEYEAITLCEGLVLLSWQEHIGSTIVHVLDLFSTKAHTFVTPAQGVFMRIKSQLKVRFSCQENIN